MQIQRASYTESPETIAEAACDCVWIQLEPREKPRPLNGAALQWLDWKLRGQISRFLLDRPKEAPTTFLPTMKRIAVPYVALDTAESPDWPAFFAHCEGLKWKRVLFFAEAQGRAGELERSLKQHSAKGYPEALVFGTDRTEAR